MRTAIVKLILLLGRYAVVPVIAAGFAALMAWFVLLDHHHLAAGIAFPVVLPMSMAAIVLGGGLLLPMRTRIDGIAVDESQAPALWAMWNELDRATPRGHPHAGGG